MDSDSDNAPELKGRGKDARRALRNIYPLPAPIELLHRAPGRHHCARHESPFYPDTTPTQDLAIHFEAARDCDEHDGVQIRGCRLVTPPTANEDAFPRNSDAGRNIGPLRPPEPLPRHAPQVGASFVQPESSSGNTCNAA